MGDAGDLAVLAFEEDTGVQEHLQEKPRLAVGEAKGGDGLESIAERHVERPALGCGR